MTFVSGIAAAIAIGTSAVAFAAHGSPSQMPFGVWQAEVPAASPICKTKNLDTGVTSNEISLTPDVLSAGSCSQDGAKQTRQKFQSATAHEQDGPKPARPFGLKATLYITTDRDSGHDSIGCNVVPMRTVAVDGVVVKRHSVLFIKETVGLKMPDGSIHDGYWYATDVGSAIHVGRIDLYTGKGIATIRSLLHLNLKTLTVTHVGQFAGCPSSNGVPVQIASS